MDQVGRYDRVPFYIRAKTTAHFGGYGHVTFRYSDGMRR
jgi:hypothetical protein